MTTPFALDGYSNGYVSSGCAAAVASPTGTSTLYLTTSYTSTAVDTVLETSTLTQTSVVATATADIITDSSFELNDGAWNGWYSWEIIAVKDAYDRNNVMELTTSSSEPTVVFFQNNIGPLNTTATYNISFSAMQVVLPSSCCFALIQEGITEGKVYGTGTSSTWTEYTFAIPGTAPNVEMMLQCSTASDIYFDAFQAVLAD